MSVALRPWAAGDQWLPERLLGDPEMTCYLGGPESPEAIRARHERYLVNDRRQDLRPTGPSPRRVKRDGVVLAAELWRPLRPRRPPYHGGDGVRRLVARRVLTAAGGARPGTGHELLPDDWPAILEALARHTRGDARPTG